MGESEIPTLGVLHHKKEKDIDELSFIINVSADDVEKNNSVELCKLSGR